MSLNIDEVKKIKLKTRSPEEAMVLSELNEKNPVEELDLEYVFGSKKVTLTGPASSVDGFLILAGFYNVYCEIINTY